MQVSAHAAYRSGIWKLYPGIGNICGSFVCNIGNWLVSKHQHIMAAEQYLLYFAVGKRVDHCHFDHIDTGWMDHYHTAVYDTSAALSG